MTNEERMPARHRIAWGATTAAMLLLSALLSLAAPSAFAQGSDKKDAESRRYLEMLDRTYKFILQNYVDTPDPKKLYEGAMKGLFESLGDPYSVFLDEAMMSRMNDVTSGEFGGVGLYISKQLADPKKPGDQSLYIEVVSPIEDTPSWKLGVKSGDLIVRIDGEDTAPLTVDEAQAKIRGEEGSKVVLTLRRGSAADFDVAIVRAKIELPTVKKALIPAKAGDVAYLRIIEFTDKTKARVEAALKEFGKSGYRAMILDVRNDPGGLFKSVVEIADLFLDGGTIVSTKGRDPFENMVSRAKPDLAVPKDKPIVLLLNRGSASASEILAGALKDNKRAYLVGENSYGKGLVQRIYPLDSTGYKMTTARYYTPSDENIDKAGIPPDLEAGDPDLDDKQNEAANRLIEEGKIPEFAKANPGASVAERDEFAQELSASYGLPVALMARLVRNELRDDDYSEVYDLEFDTALKAALDLLDRPDFGQLLADAKSVKEMVEAKKAQAAAAADE